MGVKEEMKEDPENSKKSEPEAPEDVAMKPSNYYPPDIRPLTHNSSVNGNH